MFRLTQAVRGFLRLTTLTALACVAWIPVHGATTDRNGDIWSVPKLAASVWVATLPSDLTPPPVPSEWQLVSMIADDIDADGDLDVVANDGSPKLIVWINDGTGRLNRQDEHKSSGWPEKMSGPGLSDQPVGSQTAAYVPSSAVPTESSIASRWTNESRSRWTGSPDPSLASFVSSRSPRGPPFSRPVL